MENNKNNSPNTGIFLFSKKVKNDGEIISKGENPFIHIQTDDYSGNGKMKSTQTRRLVKENWYQKWWIKFLLTVISGLIIAYFVFIFKWN